MSLNVGDTESTPLLRKVKSVEALRIEGLSRASPRFTFVPTRAPGEHVSGTEPKVINARFCTRLQQLFQ